MKKLSKRLTGLLIVVLTGVYLLATAAIAQGDTITGAKTGIPYDRDDLSWGDLWHFGETEYTSSEYSKIDNTTLLTYQTGTDESDTDSFTGTYYGKIQFNNAAPPSETTTLSKHGASKFFSSNLALTPVDAPIGISGVTIPTMKAASGTGLYSIVPASTGDYRIYVYSPSGAPTGVSYALLENYSSHNNYDNQIADVLDPAKDFSQVGSTGWYYTKLTVSNLSWSAYKVGVERNNAGESENTGTIFEGQGFSTSLGETSYYNTWSATEVWFNTVLTVSFPSSVQLGPITRAGDTLLVESDAENGTVSAQNIFGEEVTFGTNYHMPVYFTAKPAGTAQFSGFVNDSGSNVPVTPYVVGDTTYYEYKFEEAVTATAKWENQIAFPKVNVSGGTSAALDYYLSNTGSHTTLYGSNTKYTFTADYSDGAMDCDINYTVTADGSETTRGTLTKGSPSFTVSAGWEEIVVTFRSTYGEVTKTISYTIGLVTSGKTPVAKIGNTDYYYLEDALVAAVSGNTIVLQRDYTFLTENRKSAWGDMNGGPGYTVKQGVNLLLPYANGKSNFDEKPDVSGTNKFYYNTQTANVTLTVPANTTINCSGNICVDSQVFADTLYSGCPGGPHGKLVLEQGSALNMKNGSTLYAWGYITGVASNGNYTTGTITAESGSTIYESFQALGWRGGNLMKKWMNSSSAKSFAFSDYALQNIESNLQVNNGATLKFTTSLEGSGTNAQVSGTFISNSTGFLQMGTTGSVLRTYDPYNNRIKYELSGAMNVSSLKMTLASLGSIDSKDYILGLNHSMDLVINSGADITMLYDYKIMPGATVTILGKATVNGNVYIYDTADYVIDGLTYAHHQSYTWLKSVPVSYIAATGYKSDGFAQVWNGISMIDTTTPSGKVVVNGELTIASTGGIYASSNGGKTANKVITGTGKIINNSTSTAIVTNALDEAKTIYNNSFSQSVEDHNKVVTPAVGLIRGLSTSTTDYRCFEACKTYIGSEDGYWYEYTISKSVDGGDAELVGYIGNGYTISFDTSNVANSLTTANGTYTFTVTGYDVTASTGKLTDNGNGNYTLTDVTADTVLSFTTPRVAKIDGKGKYLTLQEAINAWESGDRIEMLASSDAETAINKAVLIDLNGKSVSGVAVTATGVRIMDATANGYGTPSGKLSVTSGIDKINLVSSYDNSTTIKHYVKIANTDTNGKPDGTYSFHRAGVSLTGIQYTIGTNYVLFQGTFKGNAAVAGALKGVGFQFSDITSVWRPIISTGDNKETVNEIHAFTYARPVFNGTISAGAMLDFGATPYAESLLRTNITLPTA